MIRTAETDVDLLIIKDIAHSTWPAAYGHIITADQMGYMLEMMYSLPSLKNQKDLLGHQFLIAENEQGQPIGFASYAAHGNEPNHFKLHKLYVLPDIQKKGTGKLLIERIVAQIKSTSPVVLELNVNRHNNAFHFYRKLGFDILREEDIDIGNGFFMNYYVLFKEV